ncbi:PREDICTED: reverse mRNAase [Prunus dulcis]|uniref:PREDICTED: reverse mRNAase n=1 Tax=Prunus dulcis TaxID=3755 RepID=A0A5E4GIT3_PRUDU|nr:PREDICTED: reverse mRNAase [Prunus dulcis]
MSAQLSANSSCGSNPIVVNKGRFAFRVDRTETKFSTSALASSVQNHFENYCLVGKIFGKSVLGRVIRNCLKNDWKCLPGDVPIDHIGREWYKIEFFFEEDIKYVIESRPWFVQGQIFAFKRWSPEFSPSHAMVDSIVSWVRIHFLPLHYRDEDVLRDLVSILGNPIQLDEESLIGRQDMVVDAVVQQQISEDVILVFPQLTIASSNTGAEVIGKRDAETDQHEEDNDPRWTVVANHKGKAKMSLRDGRSFKEAAKGAKFRVSDNLSSAHGGGRLLEEGELSMKGRGGLSPPPSSPARESSKLLTKAPRRESERSLKRRRLTHRLTWRSVGFLTLQPIP